MKNEKDKRLTVSTYDLDKGDFLNEYVLSEEENDLVILLNERDDADGKIEIALCYHEEAGENRSTTREYSGTFSLPKGKPVLIHMKFSYEDWNSGEKKPRLRLVK
jgi:hypothetical protein